MAAYRRDIDGLRALAILPVLLYHANVPGIRGGFVGVDIFFVISGFLITRIIAREIDEGRFSLIGFYERRARRILPALMPVIAIVLLLATWSFFPGDFEDVLGSAVAAIAFVSNFWFHWNAGYFVEPAETMPLLHSWSLAVEEQFYILFPIFLLMCARFAPAWRAILLWGVTLASLLLATLLASRGNFIFYMLPPRAWELFAGSLLAVGAIPAVTSPVWRERLAWGGLIAIFYAVFTYVRYMPFPGLAALPPVIGSALLIHCAPGTRVGRLLSGRIPVAIGLISYSLYLWHWPVLVFGRYWFGERLPGWQSGLAIMISFILAWASYRFIETPFRDASRFDRKQIFAYAAAAMAGLAAIAVAMMPLKGWPERFPPEAVRLAAARTNVTAAIESCRSSSIEPNRKPCTFGAPVAPTILVWGSSHGRELALALGERAKAKNSSVLLRWWPGCPPISGSSFTKDPDCPRFNQSVLAEAVANPAIKTVLLAGYGYDGGSAGLAGIDDIIVALQKSGKQVVLLAPLVPQNFNVPRRMASLAARGENPSHAPQIRRADYERNAAWLRSAFPRLRRHGVMIIDPARAFCDELNCSYARNGIALYRDRIHLTPFAARELVRSEWPQSLGLAHE